MQDVLRKYLCENGFKITDEAVVFDGGKYYQILSAEYTGEVSELCEYEYKLGKLNLERAAKKPTDTDTEWLKSQKKAAERRVLGRAESYDDTPEQMRDRELISAINKILS